MIYDAVIIGAGPAGATAARLLGKQLKIAIIDKRSIDDEQDYTEKCCGGLLAPDAQKLLARLGLGLPKSVLVDPQLFTVRTIDLNTKRERYYQRHYINMDRNKFDQWLFSLIPSSVDVFSGCLFQELREHDDGITLFFRQNNKNCSIETKTLIGADGARSKVRKTISPLKTQPYFAIQEWFTVSKNTPYFSAFFDRDITDFYAWTIPKNGTLIVGAALDAAAKPVEKFTLLKEKLMKLGFPLETPIKKHSAFIVRPTKQSHIFPGKNNIALIGEAAGFISPSSSEGISYAFESALLLSEALQRHPDNAVHCYSKLVNKLRWKIFGKNMKTPFMYHSLLRNLVMCSGLDHVEVSGPDRREKNL
ncbi:MAG: FAD-binding protein [Spirochaetales bacterium]|nr:FAD-binding protein [Spirochaetales bacterium]